jgi:hypothetical protein
MAHVRAFNGNLKCFMDNIIISIATISSLLIVALTFLNSNAPKLLSSMRTEVVKVVRDATTLPAAAVHHAQPAPIVQFNTNGLVPPPPPLPVLGQ